MNDIRTELVAQVAGLRRYALALTREASEAEDLVQETLTRAIAAAASWRPGTDLRAWLARIMRNAWLDALRRRGTRERAEADTGVVTSPLSCTGRGTRERAEADGPDPVSAATQHLHVEVRRAFEALRSLPGAQREAIALVAFQDMRYAEAADAMGVPLGTFMSRLARGREALRRRLEEGRCPRLRSVAGAG